MSEFVKICRRGRGHHPDLEKTFVKKIVKIFVAVAVATTGTEAEAAKAPDLSSDRIQDTEHTRAYYAAARF